VTSADLREDKRSQYAAKLEQGKRELYDSYATWARTSGYKPISQRRLTRQLGERGYPLDPGKRKILGIVRRDSCSIPDSVLKESSAGSANVQSPDADDRKIVEFKKRASPAGAPDGGVVAGPAAGADAGGARPSDEV
jgi:hypothetical protein